MGELYLAQHTSLRRKVALKILPAEVDADLERLRRFEQEAFAAFSLNRQNILTIYEFGKGCDVHYLAAELSKAKRSEENSEAMN